MSEITIKKHFTPEQKFVLRLYYATASGATKRSTAKLFGVSCSTCRIYLLGSKKDTTGAWPSNDHPLYQRYLEELAKYSRHPLSPESLLDFSFKFYSELLAIKAEKEGPGLWRAA